MSNQRTIGLLLFIVVPPLIIVALKLHLLAGLFLHLALWCCWCARGSYVLFVYFDSPIWHNHVEAHILPRLGERAVALNWSHRGRWPWPSWFLRLLSPCWVARGSSFGNGRLWRESRVGAAPPNPRVPDRQKRRGGG